MAAVVDVASHEAVKREPTTKISIILKKLQTG